MAAVLAKVWSGTTRGLEVLIVGSRDCDAVSPNDGQLEGDALLVGASTDHTTGGRHVDP
jgi:hypothetical protein